MLTLTYRVKDVFCLLTNLYKPFIHFQWLRGMQMENKDPTAVEKPN